MTEGEMVGWHHRPNGHGSEQAPGDDEGQGRLVCYSPYGCKESDTTEKLNNLYSCYLILNNSTLFTIPSSQYYCACCHETFW